MDYTVGSLADLISGSNTPNKPKVVKKAVHTKFPIEEPPVSPRPSKESRKPRKEAVLGLTQNAQEGPVQLREEVKEEKGNSSWRPKREEVKEEKGNSSWRPKREEVKEEKGNSSWRPKSELSQNEQNAHRRIFRRENPEKKVDDPEISARTLFVGNVPVNLGKKKVLQYFKKYGDIESIRIRGLAPENPKITKKVAAIKNQLHPKRRSALCYIRFRNEMDCLKALVENGKVFEGHHLRVSTCEQKVKRDESKAIFIGNLDFEAEDEELWELFKDCGPILSVRVVRDRQTMFGKGFAYINFKDSDSVQLALEMENVKLRDRMLRISPCNANIAKKNSDSGNKKQITKPGKPKKMRWRNRDKMEVQ